MEKLTRNLVSHLDRLQKRVESLLEEEGTASAHESAPFEPTRDSGLMRGIPVGLPDDHIDRAIVVFSRMAMFYDGGVLLENHDGRWLARAIFQEGHARPLRQSKPVIFPLPQLGPLQILKTPATAVIRRLDLKGFSFRADTEAFLVKPTPDFAYILFSRWPDLWLKEHLAGTVKILVDSFA